MKVELLSYSTNPEKLAAAAAKLCYSSSKIEDIWDGFDEEKTASYLEMIASLGHESVIEHANFTFGLQGVSRSLLAQITRHRLASFSVQSQRYVRENAFAYVIPPEIERIPEAREEFVRAMEETQRHYTRLATILKEKNAAGMEKTKRANSKAEKAAIEDARFVLPNACETKMIFTMNARELLHFFRLRCCERAQWEIRAVAWDMFALCLKVAPHLFAHSGPSCVAGECSEGKMSCGNVAEVRARAAAMIKNG